MISSFSVENVLIFPSLLGPGNVIKDGWLNIEATFQMLIHIVNMSGKKLNGEIKEFDLR